MFARTRLLCVVLGLTLALCALRTTLAQEKPPAPPPAAGPSSAPPPSKTPELPPAPAPTVIAATVNGQPITELSVYRGLMRENPKNWTAARKEILNYLIDNLLVDQYLTQLKVTLEAKEVDDRVTEIKAEVKKSGKDFDAFLKGLFVSEEDLRRELYSALRWDKFVIQQGTDKVLLEMFEKNKNMFDGSQVKARHILLGELGDSAEKAQQAQARIATLRKQIEDETAAELAKLPPNTENLAREKERMKILEKVFGTAALKESTCPSKEHGGDLSWFPRAGAMVEPFARAAFALKPYQMSDAVQTEFGFHLILAVDLKAGKDVKFEDAKPFVLEVYGERLREAIIANYKARSKIEIQARTEK